MQFSLLQQRMGGSDQSQTDREVSMRYFPIVVKNCFFNFYITVMHINDVLNLLLLLN